MAKDCWDHGRKGNKFGYCLVGFTLNGRRYTMNGHRYQYMRKHKLQPSDLDGLVIRHTCDNPRCINPAHLIVGTQSDNMRDKVERGRSNRGEKHYKSKLTDVQRAEIAQQYIPRSRTQGSQALAAEYGVARKTIEMVVKSFSK